MNHKQSPFPWIYYGWLVLAASFIMMFFNFATLIAIGVFFKPIIAELTWNRASISLVVFVNLVMNAVSMLVLGKTYDRFGPKWVIIISVILLGGGYIGISQMSTFFQFLVFYGVMGGIGMGGTGSLVFNSLISKWFDKWLGLIIGILLSGGCLGQFFLVPALTNMALQNGWRATCLFVGCVVIAVNLVLTLTIVRGDPEQLGYKTKNTRKRLDSQPLTEINDFDLKSALKTFSFWLFTVVMFVCGSGDFFVSTHLVPMVTDFGISQTSAGNMLAWFGLLSVGGVLLAGPASDLIGNKYPIAVTFFIRFLLFWMIIYFQNKVTFYVFSLGFGFTMMVTAVLTTTLIGKLYGFTHIGVLSGFVITLHHLGGGLFAYIGGAVFDRTESYNAVVVLNVVIAFIALVCCLLIKEKRHVKKDSRAVSKS